MASPTYGAKPRGTKRAECSAGPWIELSHSAFSCCVLQLISKLEKPTGQTHSLHASRTRGTSPFPGEGHTKDPKYTSDVILRSGEMIAACCSNSGPGAAPFQRLGARLQENLQHARAHDTVSPPPSAQLHIWRACASSSQDLHPHRKSNFHDFGFTCAGTSEGGWAHGAAAAGSGCERALRWRPMRACAHRLGRLRAHARKVRHLVPTMVTH